MFRLTALTQRYLKIAGALAILLSLVGFPLAWHFNNLEWKPETVVANPVDVEHGCDVLSAFVWCDPLQKCVRLDSEKCEGTVPASASASQEASGSGDAVQNTP